MFLQASKVSNVKPNTEAVTMTATKAKKAHKNTLARKARPVRRKGPKVTLSPGLSGIPFWERIKRDIEGKAWPDIWDITIAPAKPGKELTISHDGPRLTIHYPGAAAPDFAVEYVTEHVRECAQDLLPDDQVQALRMAAGLPLVPEKMWWQDSRYDIREMPIFDDGGDPSKVASIVGWAVIAFTSHPASSSPIPVGVLCIFGFGSNKDMEWWWRQARDFMANQKFIEHWAASGNVIDRRCCAPILTPDDLDRLAREMPPLQTPDGKTTEELFYLDSIVTRIHELGNRTRSKADPLMILCQIARDGGDLVTGEEDSFALRWMAIRDVFDRLPQSQRREWFGGWTPPTWGTWTQFLQSRELVQESEYLDRFAIDIHAGQINATIEPVLAEDRPPVKLLISPGESLDTVLIHLDKFRQFIVDRWDEITLTPEQRLKG